MSPEELLQSTLDAADEQRLRVGQGEAGPVYARENEHAYNAFEMQDEAFVPESVALEVAPTGSYVVPVFSKPRTPKPQPAAPVEAEGWYALMHEGDTFLGIGVRGSEVSSRENAVRGKKLRGGEGEIVRILPDGAHEAAIAKAREEGAAAALHDARRTLLDLADDFTGDHAQGLRHAVRVIHDKIKAAKEAGKVGG